MYPGFMSETPIAPLDAPARARSSRVSASSNRRPKLFAASRGARHHPHRGCGERAGFSRGAVHGNFADKDELAAAVVQFVVADLGPEARAGR
jgi:hypothetical protein